ncbi:ABC transporter ATP-binding protein [Dolichospermum sp. ST_con]|nr:ABC transporter ATP-binding protein [Dolichospermum sp. ST_con]MDD1419036.1 ABC transporter ATP-binding protein [Dolichospermum sp. ST_sed1]MDD1422920.1 ABC transporter ATP-binding protein [Dolichospermum sp. ST_sed9]MDD1430870.1 ABC transporter ATP-binding protein [Dolichospermum sp. ST_sed6]MDD1435248.1 ABC transporter ATP-binding protein [Dolichospermum sp. ST_sed10]MDD1439983.1 ABC transporter ATP-binding protein [Dolichospermum sp. ST_sed3]MDD1446645.1 ABC transporter ATP-binding prot
MSNTLTFNDTNIPQAVPESVIIRLEDISKLYGIGEIEVKALNNVNLVIEKGEYCSIMGPSGSGKSTAMNIIGCLDRPSTGDYYLDNLNVAQMSDTELAHIRNKKLGFVFQQFHLLNQLTALENVMLPMVYASVKPGERKERATAALIKVGLEKRLNNKPTQLSGGQQQRVAIARAIVNNPVVLLADEPTGALDSHTTQEVLDLFHELNSSGITVVIVTHESEVARQTKRIVWFRDGEVVHSHLTPNELHQVVIS